MWHRGWSPVCVPRTAYNAEGESQTSETSDSIEAMDRFVKPQLDKDLLGKETDLSASQMLRLEA